LSQVQPAPARHWEALVFADAGLAYEAILALAATPEASVRFLKGRLVPAVEQAAKIAQLIADLDSDTIATREKATDEQAKLGSAAEPALRKAQQTSRSPEVRRRAGEVLRKRLAQPLTTEEVRQVRAVEALEYCGTAEARKLLEALAGGAAEARLTQEAQAALARFRKAAMP
jgi:hypothetical protein